MWINNHANLHRLQKNTIHYSLMSPSIVVIDVCLLTGNLDWRIPVPYRRRWYYRNRNSQEPETSQTGEGGGHLHQDRCFTKYTINMWPSTLPTTWSPKISQIWPEQKTCAPTTSPAHQQTTTGHPSVPVLCVTGTIYPNSLSNVHQWSPLKEHSS